MRVFLRAVVTGFGWSLGAAIYRRVSERFEAQANEQSPSSPSTQGNKGHNSMDDNVDGAVDSGDTDDGEG